MIETSELPLAAHPETVRAWVRGWTVSRRAPAPVDRGWGLWVDVGLPKHVSRYVLPDADPAVLRELFEAISTPWVWIKVCAPEETVAALLPPAWTLQERGFMMTAAMSRANPAPPAGYSIERTEQDGVVSVRVLAADGQLAARGQIAVAGDVAVVDMVETEAAHRRRGLGSVVMESLGSAAAEHGIAEGVLAATDAGLGLYRTLGWTLHAPITAMVIEAADG